MSTLYVDSRKRASGTDSDFDFDIGETIHLQNSARLGVFKVRVADTFLSTDRGTYLYWLDAAQNSLNWAQLPVGAYTGARLAAWMSGNFSAATYTESTNEITVGYDGNRRILNDQELRTLFPGSGSYPGSATPVKPQHQPPAGPQLHHSGRQLPGLQLRGDEPLQRALPALQQLGQCDSHRGAAGARHHARSSAARAWATSWRARPTTRT